MFENDYIMRMILQLTRALRRSLTREHPTPLDEIKDIEGKVAEAVDMDPNLMYRLEPNSLVSVLQLGSIHPALAVYVVRSLYYVSDLHETQGDLSTAELRREQGDAIAAAYGIPVTLADATPEALEEFLSTEEPQ
jgi:hypothetical protein